MSVKKNHRPIFWTDDGLIMSNARPPLTIDMLRKQMIEPLNGTPASLWWSVGDHEVYHYETEIGEVFGDDFKDFEQYKYYHSSSSAKSSRITENIRHLMKVSKGPLTALIELCREADIEFFARFRMNSHYHKDTASPDYGRFRREHPELLISPPGATIEERSIGSASLKTGLNYEFPEVRKFIASMVIELFSRFDVDGVEMDFNRHPAFFKPTEAFANRHLITDLVRHIRHRMNDVASSKGKSIKLAVRVPPTLADSKRIGLDVLEWINEGLVDIVTAGVGFIPFEMPIKEFVQAANRTEVQVYGCIEALRPTVDERVIRALASRFWDAGADGIYLYNFFPLPGKWRHRVLNQIADPASLRRLDKRYELDRTDRVGGGDHSAAFRYAIPIVQLPVALHETLEESPIIIHLEISDDLQAASRENVLDKCVLALKLDHFKPDDTLLVTINGETIPWVTGRVSFDGWNQTQLEPGAFEAFPAKTVDVSQPETSIEFNVNSPPLKQGINELGLRLTNPRKRQVEDIVINGADVTIYYIQ